MTGDQPVLGISLMIGFCALAPLADAVAKLLVRDLPLLQILLVRFAVQTAILWPLARRGRGLRMDRPVIGLLAFRAALQLAGMGLMILSLRYLPLADAIAIAYCMPFILLVLGRAFLNERAGPHRLAACVVGFFGTLLVVQPSFAEVGWYAALPVSVALVFALYILVTRRLTRDVDPIGMQAINGLMGTVVLFPLVALSDGTGWSQLDPVSPEVQEIVLLLILGVLGTVSHLLLTLSLRHAPATTVAPIQYLEIPFAVFFGWLIFSQFPNGLAMIGIGVVVLSGLYVIWRERIVARQSALQPQT